MELANQKPERLCYHGVTDNYLYGNREGNLMDSLENSLFFSRFPPILCDRFQARSQVFIHFWVFITREVVFVPLGSIKRL